jgi:hypothetical protein
VATTYHVAGYYYEELKIATPWSQVFVQHICLWSYEERRLVVYLLSHFFGVVLSCGFVPVEL